MVKPKRQRVRFDGEDLQLSVVRRSNSVDTVTFSDVREIQLGGTGKTQQNWYTLLVMTGPSTEDQTVDEILDIPESANNIGDAKYVSEIRDLFPRTPQGTTVAAEHAQGNSVGTDDRR